MLKRFLVGSTTLCLLIGFSVFVHLVGCGLKASGTVAKSGGSGGKAPKVSMIDVETKVDVKGCAYVSGKAKVVYTLTGEEGGRADAAFQVSTDAGNTWVELVVDSPSKAKGLFLSPNGVYHEIFWDTLANFPDAKKRVANVLVRALPQLGGKEVASPFIVDNTAPPLARFFDPPVEQAHGKPGQGIIGFRGVLKVLFYLSDVESDLATVELNYRALDSITQREGVLSIDKAGLKDLVTSKPGQTHKIEWDSTKDLPGYQGRVQFTITPMDRKKGKPIKSTPFPLDNSMVSVRITWVPPPRPPSVGQVPINFTLSSSNFVSMRVEKVLVYGLPGKQGGFPCTEAIGWPSCGKGDLSTSPSGKKYIFVWNSFYDTPKLVTTRLKFKIFAKTAKTGRAFSSGMSNLVGLNNTYIDTYAGGGAGDGGEGHKANVSRPRGVAVDSKGNIYIADSNNHRIRRVDGVTGIITTVAGNGLSGYCGDYDPATKARLYYPVDVTLDNKGNLYIADGGNHCIRRVDAETGIITTVAGSGMYGYFGDNGPATKARLYSPSGVAVDGKGNFYIADRMNHRVRRVDGATGLIATVAGNGACGYTGDNGPATKATLYGPQGVAVDDKGNLFIGDMLNLRIRRVDVVTGIITTVAGSGTFGYSGDSGPATKANFRSPSGVAMDDKGNLYIADEGNHCIRMVAGATGIITTVAGNGTFGYSGDNGPATKASLKSPSGVAIDSKGNLYIADSANNRIRRVDGVTGVITTVAGNGTFGYSGDNGSATQASLCHASDVALDSKGNLYIADSCNHRIRRVDAETGLIITVAGIGTGGYGGDKGLATKASLKSPSGVALDSKGNLYIADSANHRIRRVDGVTGVITTVAGTGWSGYGGDNGAATKASLKSPSGVALDGKGNLYIADKYNNRIRRVDCVTGIITTIAGTGWSGYSGDKGPATKASLKFPSGVALDGKGNLYIADKNNSRIRKVDAKTGIITTVAGNGAIDYSGDKGPATKASLKGPSGLAIDGKGIVFIADTKNLSIRRFVLP